MKTTLSRAAFDGVVPSPGTTFAQLLGCTVLLHGAGLVAGDAADR